MIAPILKSISPNSCQDLFEHPMGPQDYRRVPRKIRRNCAREYFDFSKLKIFQFALRLFYRSRRKGKRQMILPGLFRPSVVKDAARLMNRHSTYRLAQSFYPLLSRPGQGLTRLTQAILEMSGRDKVTLVLERRPNARYSSRALIGKNRPIIIHLSWPSKEYSGGTDRSSLYHELGHHLMYLTYGKKVPKFAGRNTHDPNNATLLEARTSPSAAWIEGFANAMEMIETPPPYEAFPLDLSLEEFIAWKNSTLKNKLSNEFVIGSALGMYLRSDPNESKTAMLQRLDKVLASMKKHGMQNNFQEFVLDFLHDYPEERSRFLSQLKLFKMGEVV